MFTLSWSNLAQPHGVWYNLQRTNMPSSPTEGNLTDCVIHLGNIIQYTPIPLHQCKFKRKLGFRTRGPTSRLAWLEALWWRKIDSKLLMEYVPLEGSAADWVCKPSSRHIYTSLEGPNEAGRDTLSKIFTSNAQVVLTLKQQYDQVWLGSATAQELFVNQIGWAS
jgi:hypothetical protein